MTENELRENFRHYFTELRSSLKRDGVSVDKHEEWARFVEAAIENKEVAAEARSWRCPRSLKAGAVIRKTKAARSKTDNTANARSERRAEKIRQAGGATVIVRFPDAEAVSQLDSLVEAGDGKDRTAVIRSLVTNRFFELKKSQKGGAK